MAGAPFGNQNAHKGRRWAAAIDRALATVGKEGQQMIDEAAKALVLKAMMGDVQALKEVGDRIDGKPVQQIDANVSGSLTATLAALPVVAAGTNPPLES